MHPNAAISILWTLFVLYWLVSALGAKRSVRGSRRRGGAVRLIFILAALLLFRIPALRSYVAHHHVPSNPALRAAGVAICAAGLGFAVWARRHLGRNWGVPMSLREGHELVTTGPYRLVRHPIYTGILTGIIGSGLTEGFGWFIAFAFFSIYFIFSARVEEGAMMREFPQQYADYKKRTRGMILPF